MNSDAENALTASKAPDAEVGATLDPVSMLPPSIGQLADLSTHEQALLTGAHLRTRWAEGDHVRVESYLAALPVLATDQSLVASLAFQEFILAAEHNMYPSLENLCRRFPDCAEILSRLVGQWQGLTESTKVAPHLHYPVGYEILGELGRGGMGVVYKARDRRLNRLAALKMIHGGAHVAATQRLRFLAEAQSLAKLNHPHIVKVYEAGELDGCPYIALELLEGGNLATHLGGEQMPAKETAELVEILAWAVQAAHAAGVIHRDLKPANILLRPDGTPVVTDFGLAKQLDSDAGVTRSGTILGTPAYMAPEQARGERDLTHAVDVYALGTILYECLTGAPPFLGDTVQAVLAQVMHDQPLPPTRVCADIPTALEAVCLKCLQKDPHERYASAAELAEELRGFLAGAEVRAVVVDREQWFKLWAKRAGFELIGGLGGREGTVYRARHIRLKREVTLKVLTAYPEGRQAALERLERQAAIAAEVLRLNHAAGHATRPPVIEVYDIGERDALAYCATEYAPGGSLAGMIERVAPAHRPIKDAAELVQKIATALATLHSLKHTHGNLTPGNILFAADGSVTFSDLRGDRKVSDDIFALGAMLYLLLTGRAAEQGKPVPAPSRLRIDLPARLETICLTCLDVNPAKRYQKAAEVADALKTYIRESPAIAVAAATTPAGDRGIPAGYTQIEPLWETRLGRLVKARNPDGDDVALHQIDHGKRLSSSARLHLWSTLKAAAEVHHPNILICTEFRQDGSPDFGGQMTVVQEYLPGGTLTQRLKSGPIPTPAATAIIVSLAEALHHAHQSGLFHGDLDPDNVFFAADGSPRVTGFRISSKVGVLVSPGAAGDVQLETRPGYKPPEYLRREPIQLTPAADVYMLGALLAEMLMGIPPDGVFGRNAGVPDRRWHGLEATARRARRNASSPGNLEEVCRRAMEWKPTSRHATAAEFIAHVQGVVDAKGWFGRLFGK